MLWTSCRIDPLPPVSWHELHLQAQPLRHVAPQHGEVTGLEHQHGVSRRQRVDERGFPRAGAGRWVDDHRARGLKDALHPFEHFTSEHGEGRPAMIDRGLGHRAQDPLGYVGRARDLKKMSAECHRHSKSQRRPRRHEDTKTHEEERNHRDTETQSARHGSAGAAKRRYAAIRRGREAATGTASRYAGSDRADGLVRGRPPNPAALRSAWYADSARVLLCDSVSLWPCT